MGALAHSPIASASWSGHREVGPAKDQISNTGSHILLPMGLCPIRHSVILFRACGAGRQGVQMTSGFLLHFKGLCFGLRAYAVRLEALRAWAPGILKGQSAENPEI